MNLVKDLEMADQVFQGALERGEYEKAIAALTQCKSISQTLFHSDLCDVSDFHRFHDLWEYYKSMEWQVKSLARKTAKKGRFSLFS